MEVVGDTLLFLGFKRGLAIKGKVHPGLYEEQVWDKRLLVATKRIKPLCQILSSGMQCSYFNELSFKKKKKKEKKRKKKNQLVSWK